MNNEKKLETTEQLTLFLYIVEEGLPGWGKDDAVAVFARLMNIPLEKAIDTFDILVEKGFLERTKDE